ncbi:uncharacterized protein NECHADRAFT_86066 [Fusarium vanettenii 77-13-4]|uniref:Uncharacterized protein n=1 Tax=Fusarium vanettenii (strain ATCC MYA-4622 / CBS 123669 / FGSC 9596 / NRRL 45880 / 77-13-4) TaxID=660122 RepID=C7Z289_FUSV7|nr:uncharacterized protein NECHADRAFT_86066 [Fusarium vanettenii 77-13-4]EEU42131.1 predicted protein [Fusarium vanettenii 77-13-4]
MSQTWGFKPKWMVNASLEHRKVINNTCWRNIREMCSILDRAYDYVQPEQKEEFNAWQRLYRPPGERSHRPPHWRSHRNANTAQAPPDTVSEQLTEQEANLQDAFEVMMDDTVLDGLRELENAIQDNMLPRTFSLQDINVNQDTMDTSNNESTTLEDVFQLEADDEHEEEADTDLDSSFSWGDADFSLDNESQLEDSIAVQATSQPDDDYVSSDIASQMDDVTSTKTDETSDPSSQSGDEYPDLNVSPHGEKDKPAPNIVPQQDLTIPEALRDRMPGLLKAKLERNAVWEHVLATINQPSLKPAVREAEPVPQDLKETYDNAIIQIEELKSLWYCVQETQRYVRKLERNYKHAWKDLDHKACVYRHRSKVAPDYQIQHMRSKGQASRLNECIGIDEPWPEGE